MKLYLYTPYVLIFFCFQYLTAQHFPRILRPFPDFIPKIELTTKCRNIFPTAHSNPNLQGGAEIVKVRQIRALCLYGALENNSAAILSLVKENENAIDGLVLKSTGGSAALWLDILESLALPLDFIIVDQACFSSCADYGFIAGKRKIVLPGSIVMWHGGPTDNLNIYQFLSAQNTSDTTANMEQSQYLELGKRTVHLYERLQVNPLILEHTMAARPMAGSIELAEAFLDKPVSPYEFSGFALPPNILKRCYKIHGLADMWYPRDETELMRIGLSRSRNLLVASMPRDRSRFSRCPTWSLWLSKEE